jgi:FemAB-related protein (PEP-CTERM system-associated)
MPGSTSAPKLAHIELQPPIASQLDVREDVQAAEWDGFVERHPEATGDHLWHWRRVIERVFGHQCVYLGARSGGTLVGVLPLVLFRSRLFGRFAVSMPFLNYGGLLASEPEVRDALLRRAHNLTQAFGGSHLEFRHRTRQFADRPCRDHKVALTMSLPTSSDELWKTIDRKARNQVRKAQKEGVAVTVGGSELVDDFYTVFARNMRDLGTPVYSSALFHEAATQFPDRIRIVLATFEGRPIAGAVAFTFAGTLLVPWASSLREYRHLCANMLQYWTMMEHAVAAGCHTFDFGRSSRGGGTQHFKQQWGAVESPLFWEYSLITRGAPPDQGPANPRFNLAIEAWKRLPLWMANRVGPAIVRNIP